MTDRIEELLQKPYWIIDILPKRVPVDSEGQYFSIERYYLSEPMRSEISRKHINVVLKLNCYRDISLGDDVTTNPDPDRTAELLGNEYVCILTGDSLIVRDPDNTYMTLYNPDEVLLDLIRTIAMAEGLFVWKPDQEV